MIKAIKFKCPLCGKEWTEAQDTEDEWFGLATKQTLCEECSRKKLIDLKSRINQKGHVRREENELDLDCAAGYGGDMDHQNIMTENR